MSINISDPATSALFANATEDVQVFGADGELLGCFTREVYGRPPAGMTLPFTDEQIEVIRKSSPRTSRQSSDILSDLEAKHGQ